MNQFIVTVEKVMDFLKKLAEANLTEEEFSSVTPEHLRLAVLAGKGYGEFVQRVHVIDTDAHPVVPDGWKVESHKGIGKFEWKPGCFAEYLSEGQKTGTVVGNDLREELEGKPVLPATVLDYLLDHQELLADLPKVDGKGNTKCYFFWGTIYRDSGGNLCVRCLRWDGARWKWYYGWLVSVFGSRDPALLAREL